MAGASRREARAEESLARHLQHTRLDSVQATHSVSTQEQLDEEAQAAAQVLPARLQVLSLQQGKELDQRVGPERVYEVRTVRPRPVRQAPPVDVIPVADTRVPHLVGLQASSRSRVVRQPGASRDRKRSLRPYPQAEVQVLADTVALESLIEAHFACWRGAPHRQTTREPVSLYEAGLGARQEGPRNRNSRAAVGARPQIGNDAQPFAQPPNQPGSLRLVFVHRGDTHHPITELTVMSLQFATTPRRQHDVIIEERDKVSGSQ